jgi:Fe-S-cluster containining protein
MLRFEGIKEFDIVKGGTQTARNCAIIFSDDELSKNICRNVEETLNRHDFSKKNENVKIEVKYVGNIAEIIVSIYCPMTRLVGKTDEQILRGLKKYQGNFEDYYNEIMPY